MPPGVHKRDQTAYRLPLDLREWVEARSGLEDVTRTAIVIRALRSERVRCERRDRRVIGAQQKGPPATPESREENQ